MRRRSFSARTSPRALPRGAGRGEGARQAFTLVELLVVLGIIGLLAALITPVTIRALAKSRNAAIKAEIDMLHMAIMNYKNEYGSFPPAFDAVPVGVPLGQQTKTGLALRHLRRLFPRLSLTPPKAIFTEDKNQNNAIDPPEDANGNNQLDGLFLNVVLQPENALAFWLSGYSQDPTAPTVGELKPLYDFDKSRLEVATTYFTGRYHSPQMRESGFYRYVDSSNYYFEHAGNTFPTPRIEFDPRTAAMAVGEDSYITNGSVDSGPAPTSFTEDANGNGTIDRGQPFNSETFQILHPGRDGIFGTADDLSNFWPGTRQEYLDSLQ